MYSFTVPEAGKSKSKCPCEGFGGESVPASSGFWCWLKSLGVATSLYPLLLYICPWI